MQQNHSIPKKTKLFILKKTNLFMYQWDPKFYSSNSSAQKNWGFELLVSSPNNIVVITHSLNVL